jgi:hypothetical protein
VTIVERLPQWNRDKAMICERISSHIAPFKILIKTKDEPDRLRTWIAHHSGIVGLDNLIIFDNMSTDQATLGIYAQFESELLIVQFDGFLNAVHHTRIFAELYAALRESCDYFTFLDTDEYLALYDGGDGFHFRKEIVSFLRDHKKTMVFPGTWLRNLPGCNNRFMLPQSGWPTLRYGLEWGKPVISSACDVSGDLNHNRRVKYDMLPNDLITNVFVLHRLQVSSAERIRINLQKLRALEALMADDGLEEALALDINTLNRKETRAYVLEIRSLISAGDKLASIEGSFEISPNGRINWENDWQRAEMQMFVSQPLRYRDVCFTQTLVHPLYY